MRQLASKVLTGCFALISDSYGPKHVGVLGPSLRMQDAAVIVYLAVLSFRVQHLKVRRAESRLTGPFWNQNDPSLLGYLILKTPQRAGYARATILIRLDAFPFPSPNAQRPFLKPRGSQSVLIRSIKRLVRKCPPSFTRSRFGRRRWGGWLWFEM